MNIDDKVGTFIERSLHLVEDGNWYDFFDELGSSALSRLDVTGAQNCLYVLSSVGYKIDEDMRKEYVLDYLSEEFQEYTKTCDVGDSVFVASIIPSGWNLVGYEFEEIVEIVRDNTHRFHNAELRDSTDPIRVKLILTK